MQTLKAEMAETLKADGARPRKALIRRGELRAWISWMTRPEIEKLIGAGVLKPVHLRHDANGKPLDRARFSVAQIERDILGKASEL